MPVAAVLLNDHNYVFNWRGLGGRERRAEWEQRTQNADTAFHTETPQ